MIKGEDRSKIQRKNRQADMEKRMGTADRIESSIERVQLPL